LYKTSKDRRFQKVKREIRRAFLDLTLEKPYAELTVTEIAEKADINRMTFYAHYDTIDDIIYEFTDDMVAVIKEYSVGPDGFSVEDFFRYSNEEMKKEIEFFRLVATDDYYAFCQSKFRKGFKEILVADLAQETGKSGMELEILADLCAAGISYAYFDWLAGEFGEIPLEEMIAELESLLTKVLA